MDRRAELGHRESRTSPKYSKVNNAPGATMPIFNLVLIKPSHYDDDGYVIQWWRSPMPTNSLAVLNGLAVDARDRKVLGDDVEIRITAIDETNTRVRIPKLLKMIQADGGHALVGLVGVQSNQYPRALDIAREFRQAKVPVCIGGFHVSGVLAMLPDLTPELKEAQAMGVSLFAGEAEGRFDDFLRDAWRGELRPLYNYLDDLPDLSNAPSPLLPPHVAARTFGHMGSFDAGRGCPFLCSFCTIINVQGRKSRYRSADDVERLLRENCAKGLHRFFITDDDFARNRNWEAILDRIIALREEGLEINLTLQVDTKSHRIPRFLDKAAQAGVRRVFIGLESIDPDTLMLLGKKQNNIDEYRRMMLEWRKRQVFIDAGYILGLPNDTPQSIRRDIDTIARQLPVDRLQFYCLTPLPGSEDHQRLFEQGAWMDPDLNCYDLNHVTIHHGRMSDEQWREIYHEAWLRYYSEENITRFLKRARADDASLGKVYGSNVGYLLLATLEGVHPLEAGLHRRRHRRDRRHGMALENPLIFYTMHYQRMTRKYLRALRIAWRFHRIRKAIERDSGAREYRDDAIG